MRMRRKKNLNEKLNDCKNLYSPISEDRNYETADTVKEYFDFESIFGNDNEIMLEIGCGKGRFITEIAKQNPNINFIAVEKCGNVIVTACEACKDLKNVVFLRCGAEYLNKYIKPGLISRIYLNFSCPFPKNKHASHRLTAKHFLDIYKVLLNDGGEIHQKTDNMKFFEFSLEQLSSCGYALKNVSLDLHKSDFEGNIMTEYEERFVSQGLPIYRLEAYLNK